MDFGSNTADIRESVFNTINLLTDIESGQCEPEQIVPVKEAPAPQASYSNMMNQEPEEAALSDRFISGIKDKLVDPNKLEKLQNGQGSEFDRFKYQMNKDMMSMKNIIEEQSNTICSLKSHLDSLKMEIGSVGRSAANIAQTAQTQIRQAQQPMNQQPAQMQQPVQQQIVQNPVQAPPQSAPIISAVTGKVMQAGPKEPNPRIGNHTPDSISIEKYFYCGNK